MPGGLSENPAPGARRGRVHGEHPHRQRRGIGGAGPGLLPERRDGRGRAPSGPSPGKPAEDLYGGADRTDLRSALRRPERNGKVPSHQRLQKRPFQRPAGAAEQGGPSARRRHRGGLQGRGKKTGPPGGAMNAKSLWKFVPPAGPVLSLLLIGLLLLSALVYYRAVRIQRFLEPALAMSQPRNEFAESVNQAFREEFGPGPFRSLKATSNSILIERGLLFTESGTLTAAAPVVLKNALGGRFYHGHEGRGPGSRIQSSDRQRRSF